MIFEDVTLFNFGPYQGKQRVDLAPPTPNQPVVLIGSLNGGGKTTFLDALQLALFGPHAKCSNRGSLSYSEYLSRCIHRRARTTKAGVEVTFRLTVEGAEERYQLRRYWKANSQGFAEIFEVWRNGKLEKTLAENWASQVEEFFPANIAHLFLFDGEQIEAYASKSNSSTMIGAAIQNLLGLDMVDQLGRDLLIYERRKRAEENGSQQDTEINLVENMLVEFRQNIEATIQEKASMQSHRIDKQYRALEKLEEKYRKIGGELYDRKDIIQNKMSASTNRMREGEAELRGIASGAAPLLLVRTLLKSAESRDQREEECRRARELTEMLKDRDKEVIKLLHDLKAEPQSMYSLEKFFRKDQAKREALGKKDPVLEVTPNVRGDLHAMMRGDLGQLRKKIKEKLLRQSQLCDEEKQFLLEFKSIPDSDTLDQIANKRKELRSEIASLEAELAAIEQDIERQRRALQSREKMLLQLREKDVKGRWCRDDRLRILHHSSKVRRTLNIFRKTVIANHVKRIEKLVFDCYQKLLRKGGLVSRLSINPEDYTLTLYSRNGKPLSNERLSAGERQLLAIALLWGLAKASGHSLPTAIDTPLGRLDSIHRMHFVERYLPSASHQIILLSTDEEITGEYLERLSPWIGHRYQLVYNDKTGATAIEVGYLPLRKAA